MGFKHFLWQVSLVGVLTLQNLSPFKTIILDFLFYIFMYIYDETTVIRNQSQHLITITNDSSTQKVIFNRKT